MFLNFLILLKLFPNFVSNVFDIKKSDRLESPWNETYSSRIFYLKLSKCRIYCLTYFKEIGKAVKRAGKRQWIGWYLSIVRIDRRNGIRSPDKNFLDNSLPSFRVFYVFPTTFCFTAISFIPRPRFLSKGSWNSWTEIKRGGEAFETLNSKWKGRLGRTLGISASRHARGMKMGRGDGRKNSVKLKL